MLQSTQPSKLDLLHKGVYPAIAITLTLVGLAFAVWVYFTNKDQQQQLDRLNAEMQAAEMRLRASEQNRAEDAKAVEDHIQRMRMEVCKGVSKNDPNFSNSDAERQAQAHRRVRFAFLISDLQRQDASRMGEDAAKSKWKEAQQQAEKELEDQAVQEGRPRKLDWNL